jgi:hypothetical protein
MARWSPTVCDAISAFALKSWEGQWKLGMVVQAR